MMNEEADNLDRIMTRLIDAEATEAEWQAFQRHAADDPEVWRRLATEQWLCRRLGAEFEEETAGASRVELPSSTAPIASIRSSAMGRRLRRFALPAAGWAAAAALALAWSLTLAPSQNGSTSPAADRGRELSQTESPETLLAAYLRSPHVVREVEPVLLDTNVEGDSQEVVYVRRIIERQRVSKLLRPMWDENSNLVLQEASGPEIVRTSF